MLSNMSPALRRYLLRLSALFAIFFVCIFAAGLIFSIYHPGINAAYALAILPALVLIGTVWANFRLIVEETDEYLRLLDVKGNLFATGFCLTVMTAWEFLQNYGLVSNDRHGFGTATVWLIGLVFGSIYFRLIKGEGRCA